MVEFLLAGFLAFGTTESCQLSDAAGGLCHSSGALTDDGARLDGSIRGGGGGSGNSIDLGGGATPVDPGFYCGRRTDLRCHLVDPPPTGVLTLADVAAFVADPGAITTEPSGWAAIGLPFNAISTAASHEVMGTLLGGPATVRFTPVGWRWDFGDGPESVTTATGGGTWASLGVAEFEPTATSHVYRYRGTYNVTAVVTFVADYRLGAGEWSRIPGTLELPARAPVSILAVTARTVLVDKDCKDNPRGPGC